MSFKFILANYVIQSDNKLVKQRYSTMKFLVLLLLFVTFHCPIRGAKILGIFHAPSKSHHIIGSALLRGLAAKGHEVTMLSPFPSKETIPHYRDLYIEGLHEIAEGVKKSFFEMSLLNKLNMFSQFINFSNDLTATTFKSTAVQNLLKSSEQFDAVIIEAFGNEAFFGFGHHFNAQVIVVSTGSSQMVNHFSGNVAPYAFVPNVMTSYTDRMTFTERIVNILLGTVFQIYLYAVYFSQEVQYKEHFPTGPSLDVLVKNASLMLVNSHVVFETPRPYLPNMIPVGGLHIAEPKQLPQSLQKYLDEATEGVIYFSLGSNLQSTQIPEHKRTAILNTFAKLPQKVLWKFEDENLLAKPDNLRIGKWFPQSDILAHPNVKLFITHGGLLSSTEAVYRGVPVLGIPFFADQHGNTANFVNSGYGLRLLFDELTEESFTTAIKNILNDPKYQKTIREKSEIIKDQPMHPLDSAIFWVQHVLRHKGGRHLRSAVVDLSLAQYLLLDVMACLTSIFGIFVFGVYFTCKKLCCKKNSRKIPKEKKTKAKLA